MRMAEGVICPAGLVLGRSGSGKRGTLWLIRCLECGAEGCLSLNEINRGRRLCSCQARNRPEKIVRSVGRTLCIGGVTKTIGEWSKETGIPASQIHRRYIKRFGNYAFTDEEILYGKRASKGETTSTKPKHPLTGKVEELLQSKLPSQVQQENPGLLPDLVEGVISLFLGEEVVSNAPKVLLPALEEVKPDFYLPKDYYELARSESDVSAQVRALDFQAPWADSIYDEADQGVEWFKSPWWDAGIYLPNGEVLLWMLGERIKVMENPICREAFPFSVCRHEKDKERFRLLLLSEYDPAPPKHYKQPARKRLFAHPPYLHLLRTVFPEGVESYTPRQITAKMDLALLCQFTFRWVDSLWEQEDVISSLPSGWSKAVLKRQDISYAQMETMGIDEVDFAGITYGEGLVSAIGQMGLGFVSEAFSGMTEQQFGHRFESYIYTNG